MIVASANLNDFIPDGCIHFANPAGFIEAAKLTSELLTKAGIAPNNYSDEVEKLITSEGPYMVITPQVAVVHGRPSPGQTKTAAAVLISGEDLISGHGKNDPVRVIFAISAHSSDAHINMLRTLSEFLIQPGSVSKLIGCSTVSEVRDILSWSLP